jgi:hypothetical protein
MAIVSISTTPIGAETLNWNDGVEPAPLGFV